MSATGTWNITMKTPMGEQKSTLTLTEEGGALAGTMGSADSGEAVIKDASLSGDKVAFKTDVKKPMAITVSFDLTVSGDTLTGTAKPGMFPAMPVAGARAA